MFHKIELVNLCQSKLAVVIVKRFFTKPYLLGCSLKRESVFPFYPRIMQISPFLDTNECLPDRSLPATLLTTILQRIIGQLISIMDSYDGLLQDLMIERDVVFQLRLVFYFGGQLQILVNEGPLIALCRELIVK